MKLNFVIFILFFSFYSEAQRYSTTPTIPQTQTTFNNCQPTEQRTALDNLCPSLEGSHLPGCCPPAVKLPAIQCQYVVMVSRGQPTVVNGSYRSCQDGKTVSVPCCKSGAMNCFKDPVTLPFIQRLMARSNSCCFEPCPSAGYWRGQPNPNSSITSKHEFYNGSSSQCTTTTLDQCDHGTEENCEADSPCPVVPSDPGPGTGTGSGTGSGNGGGGGGGPVVNPGTGGGSGSGGGGGTSNPGPSTPVTPPPPPVRPGAQ